MALPPLTGMVDLRSAADELSGLAGKSDHAEKVGDQQPVDFFAEVRRHLDLGLEGAAEKLLPHRLSTTARSAVTQQPRPGSRRFRSATRRPSGPATNRIRSSAEPLARVTIQVRPF